MTLFTRIMSWFPFAGKINIRPSYHNLLNATSEHERKSAFQFFTFTMIYMIIMHALQALIGFAAISFETAPTELKLVFFLYGLVNSCVTLTQIEIFYRGHRFYYRKEPYPQEEREAKAFSGREIFLMFAFTLGGQFAFLIPFMNYK